jgi:hypothetical protein
VCGELATGFDGMYEGGLRPRTCLAGHEFCEDHLISAELTDKEDEDCWDGNVHYKQCPVCTIQTVSSEDLVAYLLKRGTLDREEILKEIERNFTDYKEFEEYLWKS